MNQIKNLVLPVGHCRRNPSSSSLEPSSQAYPQHLYTEVKSETFVSVRMRSCTSGFLGIKCFFKTLPIVKVNSALLRAIFYIISGLGFWSIPLGLYWVY